MKKNMKIAITPEQPLDEIVVELERIGYKQIGIFKNQKWVYVTESGSLWFANIPIYSGELTTLAELKEM